MIFDKFINVTRLLTITALITLLLGCQDAGPGGAGGSTSEIDPTMVSPGGAAPVSMGSASLSWMPPTSHTDGSELSDLAGHHVYMNDGSGYKKVQTIDNPSINEYVVENLLPGTYRFAVTAYDSNGIESNYSNEAVIDI